LGRLMARMRVSIPVANRRMREFRFVLVMAWCF
jgi:hypothetical protein